MKEEVKNKWTAALRSGKYKQGKGLLNNGAGRLCCLGVLCEVAIEEGLDIQRIVMDDAIHVSAAAYMDEEGIPVMTVLPNSVMEWADLNAPDPFVTSEATIAHLNDEEELSFAEIADIIDEVF